MMNEKESAEFKDALISFIVRASSKDATAAEVDALPAVARVLADWDKQ